MVKYDFSISDSLNRKLENLAKKENIEISELIAKAVRLYEISANTIEEGNHVGIFDNNNKLLSELTVKICKNADNQFAKIVEKENKWKNKNMLKLFHIFVK